MAIIGTVKTDDFEMDYVSFGTGEKTFVMIPGLSIKSITESASAIEFAYECFANKYTVYVFDRKKNINADYSIDQIADDTAIAMMNLGIKDAYCFGASQGGMILQRIAINHPELVKKIVLGSTASRCNDTAREVLTEWLDYANSNDIAKLNRSIFYKLYSDEFIKQFAPMLPSIENEGTPEELAQFAYLVKSCFDFDNYDELESIKCPTLVLGSSNDKVLGGGASVEIADKMGCEIYMYDNYGHAVYDEAFDYKHRILAFFR